MFRFAHPQYLWLAALVPAMLLLFALSSRVRRRRLARFGNPETLRALMPDVSTGRVKLKFCLFCLAWLFLVVAAARPQFGSKLREEKVQGIEMMLAVDVSNSMLAEDFEPTRLERTKYAVNRLFEGLDQDRVGLVVFAGEAKVQLPITTDYRMARAFARKIDPSLVSVQGTDIAQAISLASLSFSGAVTVGDADENAGADDVQERVARGKAIILITDGEGHDGDVMQAARRAAEQGIRIYTVGIGTPEGAPIRIGGEFVKDEKGDMVVSKLDEETLRAIADETDGLYVRASKQDLGLDEIVREINSLEKGESERMRFEEFDEQYGWLAGAALVLLLLEFFLLDRRNPLLARFNIFRQ